MHINEMAFQPWPWAMALMTLALVQVSNVIPWHQWSGQAPLELTVLAAVKSFDANVTISANFVLTVKTLLEMYFLVLPLVLYMFPDNNPRNHTILSKAVLEHFG